jgi:excisionase family DNA binding protein
MDRDSIPPEVAKATALFLRPYLPELTGEDLILALLGHLEQPVDDPPQLQFLTIREVMGIMAVSRDTVMRLIKSQTLRAVKFGGQWRVPVDAVKRLASDRGLVP